MALRSEIMAVGTPAPLARMLGSQTPLVMNAGGTSQDTAPLLVNNVVQVMVSAAGTGVRLKPAIGQYLNVICNSPASVAGCNIWPADGEQVSFQAVNNPLVLPVGMVAILVPAGKAWGGGSMSGPSGVLSVAQGGTGATNFPAPAGLAHALLLGNGTGPVTPSPYWGTYGSANDGGLASYFSNPTSAAYLLMGRARGTAGSPTAIQSGDSLGQFHFYGYGASAWSSGARGYMQVAATENWSDTAQGTRFDINLTPTGGIASANALSLSGGGNLTLAGSVSVVSNANPSLTVSAGYTQLFAPDGSGISAVIECGNAGNPNIFLRNTNIALQNRDATATYATFASTGVTVGNISCSTVTSSDVLHAIGTECRQGQTGPGTGNIYNLNYASPNVQMWIGTNNLGNITITSDYRIKDNVADLPSMWSRAKALRPISYSIKSVKELLIEADPAEHWGFIAHELQEALLDTAATGYKDAPYLVQSPNVMTLLATTTKALQEAMARIEALEAALGARDAPAG
jgi:Chaperone of endosialidase